MNGVLAQPLTLRLLADGDHPPQQMSATLVYRAADPYTVELVMYGGETISWRFARDLLRDGRYAPAGLGDVRVAPAKPDQLLIVLRSETSHAVLAVSGQRVSRFLGRTYALVPDGGERLTVPDDIAEVTT